MSSTETLPAQAETFQRRMAGCERARFNSDLRHVEKPGYSCGSFSRDPHFDQLFHGELVRTNRELPHVHCQTGIRIPEVGWRAGNVSSEHLPGTSFHRRFLGDLSGPDESALARAVSLAAFQESSIGEGGARPNHFF